MKITVQYNLAGSGAVCLARDFLAFRHLSEAVLVLLNMKRPDQAPIVEAVSKGRYDMAKSGEGSGK
jgi:hypothetical protein